MCPPQESWWGESGVPPLEARVHPRKASLLCLPRRGGSGVSPLEGVPSPGKLAGEVWCAYPRGVGLECPPQESWQTSQPKNHHGEGDESIFGVRCAGGAQYSHCNYCM